jgi:hypothetical protein
MLGFTDPTNSVPVHERSEQLALLAYELPMPSTTPTGLCANG